MFTKQHKAKLLFFFFLNSPTNLYMLCILQDLWEEVDALEENPVLVDHLLLTPCRNLRGSLASFIAPVDKGCIKLQRTHFSVAHLPRGGFLHHILASHALVALRLGLLVLDGAGKHHRLQTQCVTPDQERPTSKFKSALICKILTKLGLGSSGDELPLS